MVGSSCEISTKYTFTQPVKYELSPDTSLKITQLDM